MNDTRDLVLEAEDCLRAIRRWHLADGYGPAPEAVEVLRQAIPLLQRAASLGLVPVPPQEERR